MRSTLLANDPVIQKKIVRTLWKNVVYYNGWDEKIIKEKGREVKRQRDQKRWSSTNSFTIHQGWRMFGYVILITIPFFLWFFLELLMILRSCIKHSIDCFIRYLKPRNRLKQNRFAPRLFNLLLRYAEIRMKHASSCLIYYFCVKTHSYTNVENDEIKGKKNRYYFIIKCNMIYLQSRSKRVYTMILQV